MQVRSISPSQRLSSVGQSPSHSFMHKSLYKDTCKPHFPHIDYVRGEGVKMENNLKQSIMIILYVCLFVKRILFNLFLEHYILFFSLQLDHEIYSYNFFQTIETSVVYIMTRIWVFQKIGVNNVSRACKLYIHIPMYTRLWIVCESRRSIMHSRDVLMRMHLIIKSES